MLLDNKFIGCVRLYLRWKRTSRRSRPSRGTPAIIMLQKKSPSKREARSSGGDRSPPSKKPTNCRILSPTPPPHSPHGWKSKPASSGEGSPCTKTSHAHPTTRDNIHHRAVPSSFTLIQTSHIQNREAGIKRLSELSQNKERGG